MEKPKRPLSAYNLFYRYKRILLLKVSNDVNTEFINRLIMTKPGLEGGDGIDDNVSRRDNIRETLVDNLNPNTSRRNHRAGNSKLSFLEMSKLMVASWKDIDDFSLSVFEELAEEGRKVYKSRVAEYEKVNGISKMVVAPFPSNSKKLLARVETTPPPTISLPVVKDLPVEQPFSIDEAAVSPQLSSNIMQVVSPSTSVDIYSTMLLPAKSTGKSKVLTNKKKYGKKDDNRPKRPLSSYNLFYRFKRLKLLDAYDRGKTSKESTRRLIAATPGLESYPFLQEAMKGIEEGAFLGTVSTTDVLNLRSNEIRQTLAKFLSAKDSPRSHKKVQDGDLTFQEITKILSGTWKSLDEYSLKIFEELAQESKVIYKRRLSEYEEEKSLLSRPMKKIKMSVEQQPNLDMGMFYPTTTAVIPPPPLFTTPPLLSPVSPVSSKSVTSLNFGLNFFPNDYEQLSNDQFSIHNCVSDAGSSIADDIFSIGEHSVCSNEYGFDFPLPFNTSKPREVSGGEVTSDDFLELLSTLEDRM